ncbi:hypothetical protein OWO01_11950 [Natronobacillus azotifigens]|uniref:Uncharacterized protein n=1 Tax=Natronobacillus azotifigens TaxID=472978 RepID=A0A9J6REX5_9BACI|nr:hypothetical protein [Natronobacillus azotifigens]MCZ0703924.1 hypothetical protein [Natronobacillus azotifigens]
MFYATLFLIGFGLSVAGGVTIILYLNLIPAGLSWQGYVMFIFSRSECYLFFIGVILIAISVNRLSNNENE